MKYTVHFLEAEQECAVLVSTAMLLSASKMLDRVWPQASAQGKSFDPTDVEVVVVPLQRLGAPNGMSGAEVFVIYMRSARQETGSLPPSRALVVKLQKQVQKLADEKAAADAWPDTHKEQFARPIHLYSVRGYNVLVAPFQASVSAMPDEHRLKFQHILDLYQRILARDAGKNLPLNNNVEKCVEKCVEEVLGLVSEVHLQGWKGPENGQRELRYSEEYDWYLRGTTKQNSKPMKALFDLFGNEEMVTFFGSAWPNPIKLVERILTDHDKFKGSYGPVHGDLHPKNIVFDNADNANIIDFGWATNGRHVVVDYLLLDINLRAITLASQIPEIQLLNAARCLAPEDHPPDLEDERLKWRLKAVREVIWQTVKEKNAVSSDANAEWLKEYLIPYFLVVYGLLVYLDSAQNQRALLACVLAAAERIQEKLSETK